MMRAYMLAVVLLIGLATVSAIAAPGGIGLNRSNVTVVGGLGIPVNHNLPAVQKVYPLSLDVTREMQLNDLKSDPAGAGALQQAIMEMNSKPTPTPPQGSPWYSGIVVSPLSLAWPAGAAWGACGVYMECSNSFFDPWHPIPTPGKDYITMVSVNDPTMFFFDLMFRWQKPGYYMISVNATSEFPTGARPRFGHAFVPNAALTTMSPNDPASPTRWTVLIKVPDNEISPAMVGYGFFPSNPAKPGGFIQAYVGKVTVRKL